MSEPSSPESVDIAVEALQRTCEMGREPVEDVLLAIRDLLRQDCPGCTPSHPCPPDALRRALRLPAVRPVGEPGCR